MVMDRSHANFLTPEREDYIGRVGRAVAFILEIRRVPIFVRAQPRRSSDSRIESATLLA